VRDLFPLCCQLPAQLLVNVMNITVNLDSMREAIGTVVSDGYYEYVVVDYSLANNTVELWCKTRQSFYKVPPSTFDAMSCISG
jgi:hypothetical protein